MTCTVVDDRTLVILQILISPFIFQIKLLLKQTMQLCAYICNSASIINSDFMYLFSPSKDKASQHEQKKQKKLETNTNYKTQITKYNENYSIQHTERKLYKQHQAEEHLRDQKSLRLPVFKNCQLLEFVYTSSTLSVRQRSTRQSVYHMLSEIANREGLALVNKDIFAITCNCTGIYHVFACDFVGSTWEARQNDTGVYADVRHFDVINVILGGSQ